MCGGLQVNVNTVDNIRTFTFSCMCDLVKFYGMALMPFKHYGCGGMRPNAYVFRHMDWNVFIKCQVYFSSLAYSTYIKTVILLVMSDSLDIKLEMRVN